MRPQPAGSARGTGSTCSFDPPKTYPANTAFHIWHGFIFESGDGGRGRFEFQLEVDGVPATADFVDLEILDPGLSKVWVFNFPDGLSGTHTFTGHWISPDGDDSLEETVRFVR